MQWHIPLPPSAEGDVELSWSLPKLLKGDETAPFPLPSYLPPPNTFRDWMEILHYHSKGVILQERRVLLNRFTVFQMHSS